MNNEGQIFHFFGRLIVFLLKQCGVDDIRIVQMVKEAICMPSSRLKVLADRLEEAQLNPPDGMRVSPSFDQVGSVVGSMLATAVELGGCACEIHHILVEEEDPVVIAEKMADEVIKISEQAGIDPGVMIQKEVEKMGLCGGDVDEVYKKYPEPPSHRQVIRDMIIVGLKRRAKTSGFYNHGALPGGMAVN